MPYKTPLEWYIQSQTLYIVTRTVMRYFYFLLLLICCSDAFGQAPRRLPSKYYQSQDLGPEVNLLRIVIEGNKVTRTSVILRELTIHEGDKIAYDSVKFIIEANKLRLFNLQIFNEVIQNVERRDNDIIWHIEVKERWYYIPTAIVQFADRNLNTWWVKQNHDLRRASAGFTLTDKNFRGNLETLAITLEAGYTQKLGINYTRPYVNNNQTSGLGLSASITQSRQTYFNTDSDRLVYVGVYTGPVIFRQLDAGISYLYRPAYKSRHIVQAMYRDYHVGDTVVKLNNDFFSKASTNAQLIELSYRFEYNGVDNWSYSLKGVKVVSNAVARMGLTGIQSQFYEQLEAGIFNKITNKLYSSVVFRGRLSSANVPYFFRGGLGTNTDYVRGYEYYITDGDHYGLLRLDLKREIFKTTWHFPIKYFTAMPLHIYPKVFADAGYINNPAPWHTTTGNRIMYSYGAGIDIVTFYDVKLRLELTQNDLGQTGLYVHFNSE